MLPSGDYMGQFRAGAYTVTAEAVGYQSRTYLNVVIKEEGATTLDIPLEPDSDGDGVIDDLDACPIDPDKIDPGQCGCGEVDTDTDEDNTADCIDLDDDNDGMPDEWEEFYGLDPLVDDADENFDDDRFTNLEEYELGSDPTDPKDPKPQFMPWIPLLLLE
jgi:hypothetical protein